MNNFCPNCGNKMEQGQQFCPKCGHSSSNQVIVENKSQEKIYNDQKKNQGVAVFLYLILCGLFGYGIYWYIYKSGRLFSVDYTNQISINITNEYTKSTGYHYVVGTGINNSKDTLSSISVYFSCYDKNGTFIEEISDSISGTITPGTSFEFEALTWPNNGNPVKECKYIKSEVRKSS